MVTCARASLTGEGKVMCVVESRSSEKAFSHKDTLVRIIYTGSVLAPFHIYSDITCAVAQLQTVL